jgi:hypothetical protein
MDIQRGRLSGQFVGTIGSLLGKFARSPFNGFNKDK